MIQRYDVDSPTVCFESDDGGFVLYDDYLAVRQALAAARSYVKEAAKTDAHAFGLLRAIDEVWKNDN